MVARERDWVPLRTLLGATVVVALVMAGALVLLLSRASRPAPSVPTPVTVPPVTVPVSVPTEREAV